MKNNFNLKLLSLLESQNELINIKNEQDNVFLEIPTNPKFTKMFFKKDSIFFCINDVENIGDAKKTSKNKVYYQLSDNFKNIQNILKKSKERFENTNKLNTYIGYGFINGIFLEDKVISSYLFYRPVIIKKINQIISINIYGKIQPNRTLILYLLNNLQNLKSNFEYYDNIETIDEFRKYLSSILDYEIKYNEEKEFIKVIESIKNFSNELKVTNIFGVFYSNFKYEDLLLQAWTLEGKDIDLLQNPLIHDNEYYKNLELESNPLIQINANLNLYQKYALRSSLSENTLIYGPPGTGKSETITSIVSNLLIKNDTLLMTCENQSAIDIVYKRLKALKDFVLHLTSYGDGINFYKQIQGMSQIVGECLFTEHHPEMVDKNFNTHERAKDFNNSNRSFLTNVSNYIEFCKEKDSNNTDYKIFLNARDNVNNFIQNNIETIRELYNKYSNKYYTMQNEIEFISKISEFSIFIDKYNVDDIYLTQLVKEKKEFQDFLIKVKRNTIKHITFKETLKNLDKFKAFLLTNDLNSNLEFMNLLREDMCILSNVCDVFKRIKQKLSFMFNYEIDKFLFFLVDNIKKHKTFLINLKKLNKNKKVNVINSYLRSFNCQKWKKPEFLNSFIECIEMFSQIKLTSTVNYLPDLIKIEPEVFDPVIIYFYFNNHKFSKVFLDLFTKNIVIFPKPILSAFYKSKLNKVNNFFEIMNTYKSEILYKYEEITYLDMDVLIRQYLIDNDDYIGKMNHAVYNFFKENVRQNVMKQSKRTKKRILELCRIASNEISLPSIKGFIKEYYHELRILFNGWLLRPELICELVPLKKSQFEVVIFDESSQIILEKSYPILYRANRAIITGDPKQLLPDITPYVLNKLEYKIKNHKEEVTLDDSLSLIDRAKSSYWNTYYLKNHYRSLDYRLIDYSNINFYENQLIYLTQNKNKIEPFEIVDIENALCYENVNKNEVEYIFNKINEIIENEELSLIYKKILVICFTNEQKTYINKEIYEDPIKNKAIISLIKNKNLIISNLAEIQGEEGDISFISFVYDKNSTDFNLLSTKNANNFLNVAISRSKKKNIIVKSVLYKVIKDLWTENEMSFMNYIHYLDKLKLLLGPAADVKVGANDEHISSFKKDVHEYLENYFKKNKLPFKSIIDLKIGSFNTDIAIYKDDKTDIKLCLMLNEFKKHISLDEFLLDLDLYNLFIARGYEPMWILFTQWINNKELIVHKIINKLKNNPNIND